MYKVLMLVRAHWLVAASYRVKLALSLGSLVVTLVPLFFIAGALQPIMAESIRAEGGHYFAFLIVGMVVFLFLTTAVNSLPQTIQTGISNGTLEAFFATPTSLPILLGGLTGYGFVWTGARALVLLLGGAILGMQIAWQQLGPALLILGLIVLAYLAFGLMAAALVLAFRTAGPLPGAVLAVSGLLGGVYYPTNVIPAWIEQVVQFIPLTYGLRAMRQTLLEGMSFRYIAADVAIVAGFAVVLLGISLAAFSWALRYSRRSGTLAHY
jgi:ABC-2 type transport system permease protein